MKDRKTTRFFQNIRENILGKLQGISLNMIFGAILYVLVVVVLIVNMVTAFERGMNNLARIEEEQIRTAKLIEENEELKRLVKYYNSLEYKKIYARDNLTLAQRGEILFYIDRNDVLEIEELPVETEEREQDNLFMWRKLIFGV